MAKPATVTPMGIWGLVYASWAIYLSAWDIQQQRLPNHATLPAAVVVGVWRAVQDPAYLVPGIAWFALYAILAMLMPGGVGGGDLKLAPTLGWILGPLGFQTVLLAIVVASLLSLLLGIAYRCSGQRGSAGIPHGPGMLLGAALAYGFSAHGF
ncbi:Type IV leader peptidase family protein [Corynebacterium pelargi]|uniref:Type IV leader peptidase family protein n=2 Tax=Corynebacterium pelargi TaxID=1471400 RepID=A0A410W8L8_9CORY|nr:Type IV leader peptidase family protein [Corynebacterium pelargi]